MTGKGGRGRGALIDAAYDATSVTPSDSTDLTDIATRGVYIGGAGNLKVTMLGGTAVTFTSLAVGMIHPLQVTRIWSTGTTATSILAIY